LGMNVIGCDPDISVESAWKLSSSVMQASGLDELLARADFVSIHVPLNDETKNTISEERIRLMREGAVVLNFSRDGIVDNDAVCNALNSGTLHAYVCDFPNNRIKDHPKVIALPHLGASTEEAEDNCAAMVAEQVKDFIENGNIKHAVNFPDVSLPRTEGCRVCIANDNVPHMVSQISTSLADAEINILDLLNKSKSDVAYTLIDVEAEPAAAIMEQIRNIEGVLKARVIGGRLAADSSG